jgi:hypothetical protein
VSETPLLQIKIILYDSEGCSSADSALVLTETMSELSEILGWNTRLQLSEILGWNTRL